MFVTRCRDLEEGREIHGRYRFEGAAIEGGKGADSSTNRADVEPVRQSSLTCEAHHESSTLLEMASADKSVEGGK
jgi:hypothetical protein